MKAIKEKKMMIIVFMSYVIATILFEIGYCNSAGCVNLLNNSSEFKYNFSLIRIVMYVFFFLMLFTFKNRLYKEALEFFQKEKKKRILVYIYGGMTVVSCVVGLVIVLKNPLLIRTISTILITIFLGMIFIIGISNNVLKNAIITISSIGMMFSIITDFNHAIDEKKHFASAFNIAFGNFDYAKNPITDKRIESLDHFIKYSQIDELVVNDYNPSITDDVNKNDIPSTPAGYSFVAYLFPALGIWIAKLLGGSIIDLYIMGRLFNLILYGILVCIALKILPVKKNVFATVFLMPISLVLAGTYSIDGYCIGIVSIFIAYCLKIKYEEDTIKLKQGIILLVLFMIMLTAKSMAYVMVGFIFFSLPLMATIKKNKKYIPIMLVIATIMCTAIVFIAMIVKKDNVSADTRAGDNIDVSQQVKYMVSHPLADLKLSFNHIRDTFGNLNWYRMLQEDKLFSASAQYIVVPLLIFIVYVAITEDGAVFKIKDKIIFIIAFLLAYGMTSLVLYVSFTPVGAEYIGGYQTRYILPIIFLVLICLGNKNVLVLDKYSRNNRIALISGIAIMLTVFQSILEI